MKYENIIGLLDVLTPDSSFQGLKEIYFVTHLMQADLG